MKDLLARAPGEVCFLAKNLDSGATHGHKAEQQVRTASTIKLPIMVAVFGEVAAGRAGRTRAGGQRQGEEQREPRRSEKPGPAGWHIGSPWSEPVAGAPGWVSMIPNPATNRQGAEPPDEVCGPVDLVMVSARDPVGPGRAGDRRDPAQGRSESK